jgi:hypothetical protein
MIKPPASDIRPLPGPAMTGNLPRLRRVTVVLGRRYCRVRRASVIHVTETEYFIRLLRFRTGCIRRHRERGDAISEFALMKVASPRSR